jgi:hypothetical protein
VLIFTDGFTSTASCANLTLLMVSQVLPTMLISLLILELRARAIHVMYVGEYVVGVLSYAACKCKLQVILSI